MTREKKEKVYTHVSERKRKRRRNIARGKKRKKEY